MTRVVRKAAGMPDLELSIREIRTFRFAAEIADRFRSGSAFLIGDAAHRVTPRGGTGMNSAIADGHDLGWKLGWVLRGWAGDELLDTYEAERRPVVAHNIERSVDVRGSYRDPIEEIHVDLGGRIKHLWVESEEAARIDARPRHRRVDAVHRAGRADGDGAPAAAEGDAPVTVRRLPPVAARPSGSGRAARSRCGRTACPPGRWRVSRWPPRRVGRNE